MELGCRVMTACGGSVIIISGPIGTDWSVNAKTVKSATEKASRYFSEEWHEYELCEGSHVIGDVDCPRCSICHKKVMC